MKKWKDLNNIQKNLSIFLLIIIFLGTLFFISEVTDNKNWKKIVICDGKEYEISINEEFWCPTKMDKYIMENLSFREVLS